MILGPQQVHGPVLEAPVVVGTAVAVHVADRHHVVDAGAAASGRVGQPDVVGRAGRRARDHVGIVGGRQQQAADHVQRAGGAWPAAR